MRATHYRSVEDVHARCRPEGQCLIWTGYLDRRGYGRIRVSRASYQAAHRRVWLLTYGDIAADMQVHHTCNVRACLNVDHMVLLSREDHARVTAGTDDGTCKQGHDNWGTRPDGRRYCRACATILARRYRAEKKARNQS